MSGDDRTVVFQLPTVIAGQLYCVEGTVAGRTWPLTAGTFTIGRLPECDLSLSAEPGVSKVHAKILAEGDQYFLVDSESRNGTIVNGQPIQRVALQDGDEIQICACVLRFGRTTLLSLTGADAPAPAMAPVRPSSEPLFPPSTAPLVPAASAVPTLPDVAALSSHEDASAAELRPPLPPAASPEEAPVEEEAPGGGGGVLAWFGGAFVASTLLVATVVVAHDQLGDELLGPLPPLEVPAQREATAASLPGARSGDVQGAAEPGKAPAPPSTAAEPAGTTEPALAAVPAPPPPEEGQPAAGDAAATWFAVKVDVVAPEVIRARASGRVRAVQVAAGTHVEPGQVLAEIEGSANGAEVATLKESIRALEDVAENDDAALEFLKQERAKLRRLQSEQRTTPVLAPASGKLVDFSLQDGEWLRMRQVIGRVVSVAPPQGSVLVPPDLGRALSPGGTAQVRGADGTLMEARISALRQVGDGIEVSLAPLQGDTAAWRAVRFP